jgi:hypothetical protein
LQNPRITQKLFTVERVRPSHPSRLEIPVQNKLKMVAIVTGLSGLSIYTLPTSKNKMEKIMHEQCE